MTHPPRSADPEPPTPPGAWPTFPPPAGAMPSGAMPYPPLGPVPAPRPSPLPQTEVEYHQTLRVPTARWWKGVLVIALFVIGYLLISIVLQVAAVAIDVVRGRVDPADLLAGRLTMTPVLLLSVNLTNALIIPLSALLIRGFYGQPVRFMHSVVGRLRWGLLARSAAVVLPIWAVYFGLSALLGGVGGGSFTWESLALLVVVVLTTPLQAAGEEYGARGLIARAAGSWVAGPRLSLAVATLLSSLLFTLAHGAGDPWLIAFYFLFGVALSVIVWRTGGLEVASSCTPSTTSAPFWWRSRPART